MIHYLILAHKDPEQLRILCDALQGPYSRIYIHLDKNVSIDPFLFLGNTNIQFVQDRVCVYRWWFSMVQATLNSFQEILPHVHDDDHVVIMSGQDFPIKSQSHIYTFLQQSAWKSYIEYKIQPNDERDITHRVTQYYFHDLVIPSSINRLCEKIIWLFINIPPLRNQLFGYIWQRIVNFFLPRRKYLLKNYNLYWWSQRQILSWSAIQYILNFCLSDEGKKFVQAFRNTAGPDELFFQTLLLNSSHKEHIVNLTLRYMDWKTGKTLPKIFTMDDYTLIKNSDLLFARKFALEEDADILYKLLDDIVK